MVYNVDAETVVSAQLQRWQTTAWEWEYVIWTGHLEAAMPNFSPLCAGGGQAVTLIALRATKGQRGNWAEKIKWKPDREGRHEIQRTLPYLPLTV